MEEIIKIPQRQDCGLKISAGNSGETSINLSAEVVTVLSKEIPQGGEELIEIYLFKEDYIKALCFIVNKLPLFKSSSKSSEKIEYSDALFFSYIQSIEAFFGRNSENPNRGYYHPILFHRNDGRYYLKGLRDTESKFSIRDFIIEKFTLLRFTKDADGKSCLRLEVNDNIEDYLRQADDKSSDKSLPATLKSYFPIIRTKPFLLLAGISGTGKSRVVKEMAFASCPDVADLRKDDVAPGNYLLVEVKPNWHDSTELMGYESSIKQSYVLTPFVKFLYKAMRYPEMPFFVCLDEMNLAPVEQYFAEFLSVLESRKRLDNGEIISEPLIPADIFGKYPDLEKELMLGETKEEEKEVQPYDATDEAAHYRSKEYAQLCEYGLRIPQNVIVVGTVNMDETTHQFSRKVIDRAMTIEMNEVNFDDFFETSTDLGYVNDPLDGDIFLPKYTSAKQALEAMPEDAEYIKQQLPEMLKALNEALKNTPFRIAYRVQNEVVLYLAALREDQPEAEIDVLMATAFDDIMLMKVLPRIEGDEELLENPLKALYEFAEKLPRSKAKIDEMQNRLSTGHFTSFWP